MSLLDYCIQDSNQISNKTVQQIISFAGDGRLTDDSTTSKEFREFLKKISTAFQNLYGKESVSVTNQEYSV
jgi:hypothetical protein